jgi:hypothetical protein
MTRIAARWLIVLSVFLILAGLATFIGPRSRAQAQQHLQPLRSARSLRVADGDRAKVADMGPTYHFLEGRARRVTTRYEDGMAVAERGGDGSFRTQLRDAGGNELSQLAVDHDTTGAARLELSAAGERVVTQPRSELRPTLDWANLQAYTLWKDRPGAPDEVEWKGGFVRGHGAKASPPEDQPLETETEFDNGLKVVTAKNSRDIQLSPRVRRRPTLVSHVLSNGVDVGTIRWYANEKVLAWDYPGLSKGFVNEERLKSNGGWTFTPTMAWANVQGLAFYDFHSRLKAQGSVSQAKASLPQRLLNAVAPTVAANEPGCDGLHWLDNTVFRPCCDAHDKCYQKSGGCSASSWYWVPWWGNSWSCSVCNSAVTFCFMTGGNAVLDFQDLWFW